MNLRIVPEKSVPRAAPGKANESPSMDFMHDQFADGSSSRLLSRIDDFNDEGQGVEADFEVPWARVIRTLDWIIE